MSATAVLLAESRPTVEAALERHLRDDGFRVLRAWQAREALDVAEAARPDLLLLGDELPDATAAELCRRLREGEPGRSWDTDVPVIVLGDETRDPVDRVRAFDRGADDYLVRPFAYDELVARIRAILRRVAPPQPDRREAGGIVVDRVTRSVRVDGRRVHLSVKEFELLWRLLAEPTRVLTKAQLLRDVWGYGPGLRTRTLDSHASRLRRKLEGGDGGAPFVVNVWGVGYRLLEDWAD